MTGLTTPFFVDEALNGELYRGWIIHDLVPTLRPRKIVVMEDPGSHKVASVHNAIITAGARLVYLPPYSPDLILVELVFSEFNHLLKNASTR